MGYLSFFWNLRVAVFSEILQDLPIMLFGSPDPLFIDGLRSGLVVWQKVDDAVDDVQIRSVMDNALGAGVLGVNVHPKADVRLKTGVNGKGVCGGAWAARQKREKKQENEKK
jgi:hypothetical protein